MDTSALASALTAPDDNRLVRLGIVEAQNLTAVPPTLTVDGRVMRYVNRVPVGQTAVYLAEGRDPLVIGKMSEGDDGIPVGGIIESFRKTEPPGWLFCNGQSTSGYPALAAEVGPNVPDYRGRFPTGAGGAYGLGATGGLNSVALTAAQMPSHAHSQPTHNHSISAHVHGITHYHDIGNHSHSFSARTDDQGFHNHILDVVKNTGATTHAHHSQAGRLSEAPFEGAGNAANAGTLGNGGHTHGIGGNTSSAGAGQTSLSSKADTTIAGSGNTSAAGAGQTSLSSKAETTSAGSGNTSAAGDDATGTAGSGQAHENRPPFIACYFLIRAE